MLDRTIAYGLDFLFPAGDTAIGASLRDYGEFARSISDFLIENATEPGGCLIDVGANIGSICLPFAAARRDWRVIAVEAHRGIASLLSANAMTNRLTNVEVVQAAAGGETAIVEFPNPDLAMSGNYGVLGIGKTHSDMAKTLMVTLDDIAPDDVRLVKIDAEGQDANVLRGAPRLLHETRPIWLVEADSNYPGAGASVIATLLDAGYQVHWFFAPWVSNDRLKGRAPANVGTGDTNVVALPPGVPNRWGLPPVTSPGEARPGAADDYPYLKRYGLLSGR